MRKRRPKSLFFFGTAFLLLINRYAITTYNLLYQHGSCLSAIEEDTLFDLCHVFPVDNGIGLTEMESMPP